MKEEWKDIQGYNGLYQISSLGRVKSFNAKHPINRGTAHYLSINSGGKRGYKYAVVSINQKSKTLKIHRLIAQAFIPNVNNKPQINHINGNKLDNRVENLEWCTISENKLHSLRNGTSKTGESHQDSKLSNKSVKEVRESFSKLRGTGAQLARKYGVSETTIYYIWNNKTRIYG